MEPSLENFSVASYDNVAKLGARLDYEEGACLLCRLEYSSRNTCTFLMGAER